MDWMPILKNINKPTVIWEIKKNKLYYVASNELFGEIYDGEINKGMNIKKVFKIKNSEIKRYISNASGEHIIDNFKGTYVKISDSYIYETYNRIDEKVKYMLVRYRKDSMIITEYNKIFQKITNYNNEIISKPLNIIFKNPLDEKQKQTNWLIKKNGDVILVNVYKYDDKGIVIKRIKYNIDLYKNIFEKIPNPIVIFKNINNTYVYHISNELFIKMRTIWNIKSNTITEMFGDKIIYNLRSSMDNHKIEKIDLHNRIYDFLILKQAEYLTLIIVDITDKTLINEFQNLHINFFDNINHEIRTSINCILSTVNTILDTSLTIEQKEYINIISDCNTSIFNIMNDIIDYINIKLGIFELSIRTFNIKNEIKKIIDNTRDKIKDMPIEFVVNIADNIPMFLEGDTNRISQILYSFLANAIKFTESGKIIFDIYKVNNSSPKNNSNKYIFSVKDTGCGIPENKQNDIFTLFYHLDRKPKYRGIGLGLALCKELCEVMNGKIWFESKVNVGSTFYLCISLEESTNIENIETITNQIIKNKRFYIKEGEEVKNYLQRFNIILNETEKDESDVKIIDNTIITDDKEYKLSEDKLYILKVLNEIFTPLKGSKFEYKLNNDLSILISDNNTSHNLINMLNRLGYFNIDITINAEDTINKIFGKKEYDLHLIDLKLQNINAYEMAKIINGKLTQRPFIIAIVDSKNKNIISDYKKYGIDAYIFKPIDEFTLKSLLKVVNKHRK
jgi:signal transduction histidine kinase